MKYVDGEQKREEGLRGKKKVHSPCKRFYIYINIHIEGKYSYPSLVSLFSKMEIEEVIEESQGRETTTVSDWHGMPGGVNGSENE